MLQTGTPAPAFELADQDGSIHTLDEYRGKKAVIYFYPKDNTSGCSKQASGFNELLSQFGQLDTVIIGISKDSIASHRKFADKYGLKFTLLADPELKAIQAYDVWHEKKLYGKVSMGVVRTTYVIDENGIIIAASDKVKAADNPRQTLELLEKA